MLRALQRIAAATVSVCFRGDVLPSLGTSSLPSPFQRQPSIHAHFPFYHWVAPSTDANPHATVKQILKVQVLRTAAAALLILSTKHDEVVCSHGCPATVTAKICSPRSDLVKQSKVNKGERCRCCPVSRPHHPKLFCISACSTTRKTRSSSKLRTPVVRSLCVYNMRRQQDTASCGHDLSEPKMSHPVLDLHGSLATGKPLRRTLCSRPSRPAPVKKLAGGSVPSMLPLPSNLCGLRF